MNAILESASRSLAVGGIIALFALIAWIGLMGGDATGTLGFVARSLHVLAAMVWVGLIVFVNFIQLKAVAASDEAGRKALMQHVVPGVAITFRHASHLVVATGLVLLVTSGYMLDRLVFTTSVYVPPARNVLLWGGVAGGIAMWGLVHLVIWPSLRIVLGQAPGDGDAKATARRRVMLAARVNLILMVPVTVLMIAAAHLY